MQTKPPEQQKPREYQALPPYDEEDEINLLDLFIVLLKHKWLIMGLVFFAGIGAVFTTLLMSNIYRSEATIIPRREERSTSSSTLSALRSLSGLGDDLLDLGAGGSTEKFQIVLESQILTSRILSKHKHEILPFLYEDAWDKDKKAWKTNPSPTTQTITRTIRGLLSVQKEKSGVLKLHVDFKDPSFAKNMVDYYLTELSESLREETLMDALENQRFLRRQLERTSDVLMKEKIYDMLAREIEKETFARAQKYYSFLVLDPPIVQDLDKRVAPKRKFICILSVMAAFFVAIFLAFFLEYLHNIRTREDPKRLQALRNGIKLPGTPVILDLRKSKRNNPLNSAPLL